MYKKLFILLLLIAVSFNLCLNLTVANAENKNIESKVYHLFTHALIAYPYLAFDKNNEMRKHYDKDCITVKEFKSALSQLYKNGFILVSPSDVYEIKNEIAIKKTLKLKKKPLILSFDDINYYSKKMNRGMNDKIVLHNNQLATYTHNATTKINYNNEVITVLENFIRAHPDFSYNNAKATICLTGFDGILGYRTQSSNPNRNEEIQKVIPIINKLKSLNWKFACHSYGHYAMKKTTYLQFAADTDKWLNEVQPLIGKTEIYVYPYGEYEINNGDSLSAKHKYLLAKGFKLFCGVGDVPYFNYMPYNSNAHPKCLFMDRIPLDGYALRHSFLDIFFDSKLVYDAIRDN
ncbi:MAG: hypothetical protein RR307_06240 [Clostridia bacterium]